MSAHPSPEQLGAYLDGELDASARATVDAHLRECAECGAHLADLSAVDDAARGLPVVVPEGYFEDFATRVRARLANRAPVRWRPPVWGWAAAAALLLAVITPLALQDHRRASPTTTPQAAPAPAAPAEAGSDRDQAPGAPSFKRMAQPPTQAPPATVAVPQAPAPTADLRKEQERDAERANDSRLARRDQPELGAAAGRAEPAASAPIRAEPEPKREEAAPQQGTAEGARSKEKLSDEQAENLRALGYVAPSPPPPPPSAQRQHGPRAQGPVGVSGGSEARKAASAPESKDKVGFTASPEEKPDAAADAPGATLQESVAITPRSRDVGQGPAWAKFRSLADSAPPRADSDARLLREAWRNFASENPGHPQADEARVRLVEAGVLAYRLGRRPQDREIALRDGRAYLERPAAPQADRVRAALKTLEPAAP